jgi:carboxymethylenebutenolidase
MRSLFAVLCLSLAAPSFAAEETVKFKRGADEVSAFTATPEGKGPFPAVVLIHEWWGLDSWVKDQARALAKEGYVALAADLYRGKVTDKQEEAHQYMMGLPEERAVQDLKAAVDYLSSRKDVKADAIGVVGWCMGGKYALKEAVVEPRAKAVVAYYGMPPQDESAIAKITAPVLLNYGADDKGPSPDQGRAFEAAMKKAGKPVDLKIYEGAPHAFANPNNPWGGYREAAAKDAWSRTTAFFEQNLKGKAPAPAPAEEKKAAEKKSEKDKKSEPAKKK